MNTLYTLFVNIVAITVTIPWNDLTSSSSAWQVIYEKRNVFDFIKLINDYVWFFLFFIAMVVLVWWWIQLFTSEWDPAYLKKANMTVVYWLIWIVISVSAYFIVKLLVNVF